MNKRSARRGARPLTGRECLVLDRIGRDRTHKAIAAERGARPLTGRECLVLDRIGRDRTHKAIAAELGVSIDTVANLAAKAYRKLGAHGAAAAVLAHRDAHAWCGTRIDCGQPDPGAAERSRYAR